jgi:type III restriction enzyme
MYYVSNCAISKYKARKKWFVENRWSPAVNALQEKYRRGRWHFIEITNDIRNNRTQLLDKIRKINL